MTTKQANGGLTLASKLATIGGEIGAVGKTGKNTQQSYNYIEYGVVAGKIRELFDKYHIIIIPSVESVQQDEITNKYGGKGYHYILSMTFLMINGDDPEDREVASWTGEASDYGDKGINKAETAGTKYFLMRLFNVSEKGDEDADKTTPEAMTHTVKKTQSVGRRWSEEDIEMAKVKLGMSRTLDELRSNYGKLGAIALDEKVILYKDTLKEKLTKEEEEK